MQRPTTHRVEQPLPFFLSCPIFERLSNGQVSSEVEVESVTTHSAARPENAGFVYGKRPNRECQCGVDDLPVPDTPSVRSASGGQAHADKGRLGTAHTASSLTPWPLGIEMLTGRLERLSSSVVWDVPTRRNVSGSTAARQALACGASRHAPTRHQARPGIIQAVLSRTGLSLLPQARLRLSSKHGMACTVTLRKLDPRFVTGPQAGVQIGDDGGRSAARDQERWEAACRAANEDGEEKGSRIFSTIRPVTADLAPPAPGSLCIALGDQPRPWSRRQWKWCCTLVGCWGLLSG
jgi:hypothetical protein